jgi:hypothetical protein
VTRSFTSAYIAPRPTIHCSGQHPRDLVISSYLSYVARLELLRPETDSLSYHRIIEGGGGLKWSDMEVPTGSADPNILLKKGKEISRHQKLESTDLGDCRTRLGRVSDGIDQTSVCLQQGIRKRVATRNHAVTLDYLDSLITASTQLRPWELSTTITSRLSPASRHEGSIKNFFTPSRHTHAISLRATKASLANNLVMEATAGGSSYKEATPVMSSKQDATEDVSEGTVSKQIRAALTGRPMEPSINDSVAGAMQTCLSIGDPPEQNDRKYGINVWEQAIHSQMCIWDEFNEMLFLTGSLASRYAARLYCWKLLFAPFLTLNSAIARVRTTSWGKATRRTRKSTGRA